MTETCFCHLLRLRLRLRLDWVCLGTYDWMIVHSWEFWDWCCDLIVIPIPFWDWESLGCSFVWRLRFSCLGLETDTIFVHLCSDYIAQGWVGLALLGYIWVLDYLGCLVCIGLGLVSYGWIVTYILCLKILKNLPLVMLTKGSLWGFRAQKGS